MTNEEKDRKEYELGILLAKEEDLSGLLAVLASHHVENASEPRSKRLTLAYEIKGHTEAVFTSLTFKAFGDEVKALEQELILRPDVLRSLVVKTPKPSKHPVGTGIPSAAPVEKYPRTASRPGTAPAAEPRHEASSKPLSNEALEKKIEEILG
jgi:ribosomal protein S6